MVKQGGAPDILAIRQCFGAFRRVENECALAVLHGVDDVRAPLQNFVDSFARNAVRLQVPLGARAWR